MSLEERLLNLASEPTEDYRTVEPPKGWQPGVVWDGTTGTITTSALTEPPTNWGPLLAARGMDPEVYEVVGDTIKWCSYDGWKRDSKDEPAYSAVCYSYRAEIRLKRQDRPDYEDLLKEILKAKPPKKDPTGNADQHLVVLLSDWQVGNGDAGGAKAQLAQIARLPEQLVTHIKGLRKGGRDIGHVVLAGMGDLVENTCGFYPSQPFLTELDRREQTRVVRRGVLEILRAIAPHVPKITVTAVAGNHGENRQNGKRITGFGDNDDVAVFEQVAEICAENPTVFGHVGFRLPTDRIATSIDLSGHIVAFTHGHLAKPSGNPANTLWNWWEKQAMGREYPGVADAGILCSGHYHHLNCRAQQNRVLFIAPSLTAVGDWWANATGMRTDPGTLTFCVDPSGWSALEILR